MRTIQFRRLAAGILFLGAAPVFAQDAAPEAPADAAPTAEAAPSETPPAPEALPATANMDAPAEAPPPPKSAGASGGDEPMRMDEIVVTAQKREERVQDVPISMSVINDKQLRQQNIGSITDLTRATPSIETGGNSPSNPDVRISIRGISTESFSITAEQAVSIVVDGVVLGKTPSVSLFDISRVEVLRGPQGTLFGKNSSAGVINITTNAPNTGKFGTALITNFASDYDYRLVQGMVNIPISEGMALRLNAGQSYTKGFLHNAVRGDDSLGEVDGARARFLWDITPSLTFNLIGDWEKQKTTEMSYIVFDRFQDPDTGKEEEIPGCNGTHAGPSNRTTCNQNPTNNYSQDWGVSGQFDLYFGDYAVTSITAVRRYTQDDVIDVDGMPGSYYDNGNTFDNHLLTQELRLASPKGQFAEYVVGLYYSDSHVPNFLNQKIGDDVLLALPSGETMSLLGLPFSPCSQYGFCVSTAPVNQPNRYTADLLSEAAFGNLTLHVLDDLRLLAGARWTRDDVKMVSTSYIEVPNTHQLIAQNQPLEGRDTVDNISWRGGLQYDVMKDVMSYLTVSHGYKGPQIIFTPPNLIPGLSGTNVHLPKPAFISVVQPEYPMDYELGVKSTFFDGLIAADVNLFYTRIKDFQSSVFDGANAKFIPKNVSHVTTKGVEVDLFGYLYPGLALTSGMLYNSVTYPHHYLVACTQVGPKCPNTDDGTVEDVGGEQLTAAPRWKATMAGEYEHDFFFGTNAFIGGDAVYRSKIRYSPSDDDRTVTGPHAIFGARAGIRGGARHWEVAMFCRNLTDERVPVFLFAPYLLSSATAPGQDTAGHVLTPESFRLLGLSVNLEF